MAECSWCGSPMPAELANARPCDRCFDAWPKCAVPACENKCCLRLGSKYCWPHTPGTSTGPHMKPYPKWTYSPMLIVAHPQSTARQIAAENRGR